MILSALATIAQLGLVFHAAAPNGAEKTFAAARTRERASNTASPLGRSAAKSSGNRAGSRQERASGVGLSACRGSVGAAVAVPDEDARAVLKIQDSLRRHDVIVE